MGQAPDKVLQGHKDSKTGFRVLVGPGSFLSTSSCEVTYAEAKDSGE